jgi:hypothetical protein
MNTIIKILIGFAITFEVTSLNAQADLCDNCYVWEFTTDNGERDQTTRLLSNDVEDILSQYSGCKVLQRSRFARLQEQINNEKDVVQSLTGVRSEIKSELKTIQAKRVIFGTVNRDFQGNVSLRLSFENLQTSHVKNNTVFLINEDYYNFDKRKEKLTAFINSFVNPDGKMQEPIPENKRDDLNGQPSTEKLGVQEIDNIELVLMRFKQIGSKAIFYFTLENKSAAKSVREFKVHINFSEMNDQEGNVYDCKNIVLGNGQKQINLIYGNPVKCSVEFNVGMVAIKKAAYLKIGSYNFKPFEFTNIKVN